MRREGVQLQKDSLRCTNKEKYTKITCASPPGACGPLCQFLPHSSLTSPAPRWHLQPPTPPPLFHRSGGPTPARQPPPRTLRRLWGPAHRPPPRRTNCPHQPSTPERPGLPPGVPLPRVPLPTAPSPPAAPPRPSPLPPAALHTHGYPPPPPPPPPAAAPHHELEGLLLQHGLGRVHSAAPAPRPLPLSVPGRSQRRQEPALPRVPPPPRPAARTAHAPPAGPREMESPAAPPQGLGPRIGTTKPKRPRGPGHAGSRWAHALSVGEGAGGSCSGAEL